MRKINVHNMSMDLHFHPHLFTVIDVVVRMIIVIAKAVKHHSQIINLP